jgi:hypothetical protein
MEKRQLGSTAQVVALTVIESIVDGQYLAGRAE